MDISDLHKLKKSELIALLLNQNKIPIHKPRKNVKQMAKEYEDNIIPPPQEFRDRPVPKPRKSVRQMAK